MKYKVELLKEENYKPTFWSGGMATELTTYPLNSDYASKNFLWRLGVAKIDIPESTFSSLPKVSRKFMVIEGRITLDHENRYKKLLKPFDQDDFMGDWVTKTYGKASVFNLMTRENYSGELLHLNINPSKQLKFDYKPLLNKDLVSICFYTVRGGFNTTINDKGFETSKNDLIIINCVHSDSAHEFMLYNNTSEITDIIVSIICRN
ncbi:HutD family protein [Clostridium sp. 'White wine YQ']|uniref:HutD family protein n=1 Tax=Clostridium sp. 'White wine YQ' TaxID=3027474 RepID=UPI002365AB1A|nr:HutD family protein [Clostridium sp. 'White wine YQ']MDD7795402.1 HutD family protein [Clostridium sp. 'White wine YQ']